MEKEFIPYEQALALKELRFDESCIGFYNVRSLFVPDYKVTNLQIDNLRLEKCCLAPTFAQAFRWFREKYDLQSIIIPFAENSIDENSNTLYYYIINKKQFYGFVNAQEEIGFNSQEEAELECLKKLIEIVKEQK
jgi:hypothetical protein